MSSDDDTRILNMRINNKDFLKGTSDSLKALDNLNKGIDGAGKGKGMQNMAKGVDTVKTKFGALQIAGVTALATITNKAVNAGINLAKSFTIQPIIDGFREYEKLLTSTQTISANTGLTSAKGLKKVEGALDNLNKYSDQTIYNFGQMADSIGKFTAAGGKGSLMPSVDAIKGLANSAALAGSDVNQLNTAMYQMSQAMATGTIKLMDWNSLANAGMGGANMQKTLKLTAQSIDGAGAAMQSAIGKAGSFRESLSEGWLTTDIFSKGMKVMGGVTEESFKSIDQMNKLGYSETAIAAVRAGKSVAYSVKQLKQMGYSTEAAKQLHKLSQSAIESATKIKTFTQLIDVIKESVGSGWATIFRSLFGNLKEAGELWTTVGDKITGFIDGIFNSLGSVLDQWRKLGGYQKLWGAFGNIFKSIGNLLRPIVVLFQSILPSTNSAGTGLYNLTNAFYKFSVWLEKATSGTSVLTPVMQLLGWAIGMLFKGVGMLVSSWIDLVQILSPIGSAIGRLVQAFGELGMRLLDMVGLGGSIGGMFDGLLKVRGDILTPIVNTIVAMIDSLTRLVETGDFSGFKDQFKGAFDNLLDLGGLINQGKEIGANLIAGIREGFASGAYQSVVSGWVSGFLNFFKGLLGIHSPSTVFMEYGKNIVEGLGKGIADFASFVWNGIKSLVSGIGDAFKGIDKYDLANIFSVIFGASVFLTMRKFIKTITAGFEEVQGVTTRILGEDGLLGQTNKTMQSMQTGIKAKALLNIAIAIGVLSVSLWVLSKIPYERLGVGLAAISVMLYELMAVMKVLAASKSAMTIGSTQIISMGIAMAAMAAAVLLLSAAVAAFGAMPTEMLVKGGIAVAVMLGVMSLAAIALGKASTGMAIASVGLLAMSTSLLIMAAALTAFAGLIKLYEQLDLSTIAEGMAKMGLVLVALGIAMAPLAMMAPGVLIASAALAVLSVSMTMMMGTLLLFNAMSWGTIIGGVAKLGVFLIALGVAGMVAAPGLIALGVAATLLGVGLLAAGAGMALLGAGMTVVAAAGVSAAAVLVAGFESFLALLPIIAVQLVAALDSLLGAIADKAPSMIDSLVKIVSEALRGIRELIPEVVKTGVALLEGLLKGIVDRQVAFFEAGIDLILGFLETIGQNMPRFQQAGTEILTAFITGIGANAEALMITAAQTIMSFLTAMDQAVQVYAPQMTATALSIARHLILGIAQGLVPDPVFQAFSGLVRKMINFFKGLLGINSPSRVFLGFGKNIVQGLANGIKGLIKMAVNTVSDLVKGIINVAKTLPGKFMNALSNLGSLLKGLFNRAFDALPGIVKNTGRTIVSAVKSIPGSLKNLGSMFFSAGKSLMDKIFDGFKQVGSIGVSIGKNLFNGVIDGINAAIRAVNGAIPNKIALPKLPDIDLPNDPIPTIPHFAKGVTGFGGGSALVGEAGPELVTLNRGSNVITNKVLSDFIKQVNALTKVMMKSGNTKKSPGGSIQYVVSSEFRGDPKQDGLMFASNIAAGLIQGLKAQQSGVDSSMADMATGMSQSFADILGIRSPSKVFKKYAGDVSKGFILGLAASVKEVKNAAGAWGKTVVKAISSTVTDEALKLESLRGRANALSQAADALRKKAKKTKNDKEERRLNKRAKELDKLAKKQDKTAQAQAKKIAAAQAAADKKAKYKAADEAGKAEMDRNDAINAAKRASDLREKSISLRNQAKLIQKYDKAQAKKLRKQAAAALKSAKTVAQKSEDYAKKSAEWTKKIKPKVDENQEDINKQLISVTPEDIAKAQSAFDSYAKSLLDAEAAAKKDLPPSEFKFEQNNYSPEAISPSEAYRNGKSLVSIMERKLSPTP